MSKDDEKIEELKKKVDQLEQEKLQRDIKRTAKSAVHNSSMRMTLISFIIDESIPIALRKDAAKYMADSYQEYYEDLKIAEENSTGA